MATCLIELEPRHGEGAHSVETIARIILEPHQLQIEGDEGDECTTYDVTRKRSTQI